MRGLCRGKSAYMRVVAAVMIVVGLAILLFCVALLVLGGHYRPGADHHGHHPMERIAGIHGQGP